MGTEKARTIYEEMEENEEEEDEEGRRYSRIFSCRGVKKGGDRGGAGGGEVMT